MIQSACQDLTRQMCRQVSPVTFPQHCFCLSRCQRESKLAHVRGRKHNLFQHKFSSELLCVQGRKLSLSPMVVSFMEQIATSGQKKSGLWCNHKEILHPMSQSRSGLLPTIKQSLVQEPSHYWLTKLVPRGHPTSDPFELEYEAFWQKPQAFRQSWVPW